MVGEQGPELFAPGTSGTIIPNHVLNRSPSATNDGGASGPTQVTVIVNAQTGQSKTTGNDGDLARLGQLIGNKVREVIVTEKRQGGLLAA